MPGLICRISAVGERWASASARLTAYDGVCPGFSLLLKRGAFLIALKVGEGEARDKIDSKYTYVTPAGLQNCCKTPDSRFWPLTKGTKWDVQAPMILTSPREPARMPDLYAYTDGACSGNPGPGGWGALLIAREGDTVVKERELSGGAADTTNNRMELLAAISALESLSRDTAITIVTDSSYVKDGITNWIHGWKKRGWKTAAKKPVKNEDLWRRLDEATQRHNVTWEWVKGHAGHPENERADELARAGMAPFKPA